MSVFAGTTLAVLSPAISGTARMLLLTSAFKLDLGLGCCGGLLVVDVLSTSPRPTAAGLRLLRGDRLESDTAFD